MAIHQFKVGQKISFIPFHKRRYYEVVYVDAERAVLHELETTKVFKIRLRTLNKKFNRPYYLRVEDEHSTKES